MIKISDAWLADIVDIAHDAIIIVDQDQRVTVFNKGAEKIFEHDSRDVIGQPLDMLIPEAFRAAHGGHISAFGRSSDVSRPMSDRRELAGLRKDGTIFPAEASITKLELGETTVFTVILHDITDRKRAEAALRESEALYTTILNNMPTPIGLKARDGRYLFVNKVFADRRGMSVDEIKGKTAFDLWPTEIAEHLEAEDRELIRTGSSIESETDSLGADGVLRQYWGVKFPIFSNDGNITNIGSVHTDITERKRVESALRLSERRLADIFNASPALIMISEIETGRIVDVNDAVVSTLGYTREEMIGKTSLELGIWVSLEKRVEMISTLEKNGSIRNTEFELRAKNGESVPLLFSVEEAEVAGVVQLIGVMTDITERKRAEQALAESEARLRAIFDNSPVAISLKDTEGRYLIANKIFRKWQNLDDDEYRDKTVHDFLTKEIADRSAAHEKLVMETGVPEAQERHFICPDGVIPTCID